MQKLLSQFFDKFKNVVQTVDQRKLVLGIILIYSVLIAVIIHFRFAVFDEKLFLHETVMMSEILKKGEWIANYGVGVHGFIFKLPIALIFIVTGPNIYIATLFHVVLAAVTAWIFYLLISENLKIGRWSIIAVILLLTNYGFFSYTTTFHREIPVLFSLVLFTYTLIKDDKKLLLKGLLLLLILEAKEYVFFAILPPLIIYFFTINFSGFRSFFSSAFKTIRTFLLLLIPSVMYLFIMFYTSLIPINMFNASLLGLTTSGFSYQTKHTLPESALSDMSSYTNHNIAYNLIKDFTKEADDEAITDGGRSFSEEVKMLVLTVVGYSLAYLEKLLYITNFSFQGIPLVIIIMSLVSSIFLFKEWYRKDKKLLFLNIFYWSYLVIYMIRSSHQRYILTIIPFSIIFLIYFLIQTIENKKTFRQYFLYVLVVSGFLMVATFIYQDFGNIKELFNMVSFAILLFLLFLLFVTKKYRKLIVSLIAGFIIGSSIFLTSFAILTKNQIYKSQLWGINGETEKIANLLEPEDIVYFDCQASDNSEFTYLVNIFRANNYLPIEWHWMLDKQKIGRELDAIEIKQNFYYMWDMEDMEEFQSCIRENGINKLILLKSDIKGEKFPLEDYIEVFKEEEWLTLDSVTQLKNKKVLIFEVIDNEV